MGDKKAKPAQPKPQPSDHAGSKKAQEVREQRKERGSNLGPRGGRGARSRSKQNPRGNVKINWFDLQKRKKLEG